MTNILFFLSFGFLVAVITTPWVIRLAHAGVGLDSPDEGRKRQATPIPRIGGIPLMLTLALGVVIILMMEPLRAFEWFPILVGSVLMYALGLWDDIQPLGAKKKLVGQIAIAALVTSLGLGIEKFSFPGYGTIELGGWSWAVTILWLIAIPNIVNLIDGFDGLAGGLGLFMSLTLGLVGNFSGHYGLAWFAFLMAGALMGFLIFNFPPAKIYLGDGGAYLIGFMIAVLSLSSSHKGSVAAALLVTVVGLGLPILDTSFALVRRAMRGFPLFHADDEHLHHRLEKMGVSKRRILIGLYGICVILSLIGLAIFWNQGGTLPIAIGLGVFFVMVVGVVRHFLRVRSWTDAHRQIKRVLSRRQAVQYTLLQAKLLGLEVDRCERAEEFWHIVDQTMRRVGFVDEGETKNQVQIKLRHNGAKPWVLHASLDESTAAEWQRIAECFRPAYVKALAKWGAR
jgi:UDP-GlcNAc:undecaprenyl-phosphate/decaprenyl-phosphate GlcNAc-1-phosphate transferase